MSCRMQNLEQSRLKLDNLQLYKKSLHIDIDLLVSFSEIGILKETVLGIRNML